MKITERSIAGYERVLIAEEESSRYHAVIAVHSTALGPAVGGTRVWQYPSEDEALHDALRLARGMTYKNALAGLPFGGGKSVILSPGSGFDREALFRAHGRLVASLAGAYITAEDVGTSTADMEVVRRETSFVGGLAGLSGDPSPHTARGVFRAMLAAAAHRWGTAALAGRTVALQGCGHVGEYLARELNRAGASLILADVDSARAGKLARELGADVVSPNDIYSAAASVFAPCALGGILNDSTIPQLRAEIICGGANNQLLDSRHGEALLERGILYVPDYAANAGGVINGCCREWLGWSPEQTSQKVEAIHDTIAEILRLADRDLIPPHAAADRLAEARLAA
ncbi:MAG: Glu/Leu/Phe/Val dehydrogenase [Acidobacteria bacterium]|nr:Glu/Leu/Phe/Val dehydrogenase [Acidobacteriota bacterium]